MIKASLIIFFSIVLLSTMAQSQTAPYNKIEKLKVGDLIANKLEVQSTTKSSIPCPSMTQVQRDAISLPQSGSCVYDSTNKVLSVYDGASWINIDPSASIQNWQTGKAYKLNDLVIESDKIYQVIVAHTSTTFASQIANWKLISGVVLSEATGSLDSLKISSGLVSNAEFDTLDNVSSNIQTQLNGKEPTVTGAASTITSSDLTTSRALVSDGSGKVSVSSVTSTELDYLSGVSSAIQTQLNGKQSTLTDSAGLASALSDETGTGLAVFNDSPTFSGVVSVPDRLASDNSGAAANTKYVDDAIATVVSGGVNDASSTVKGILKLTNDLGGTADLPTVPALTDSASLAAKIPDETGTGSLVFDTAPSLNSPVRVKAQPTDAASLAGTNLYITGGNGSQNRLLMDAYGSLPGLVFRRSQGTQASPTPSTSGGALGTIDFFGYGSTGYSSSAVSRIQSQPTETWTDSAQGTDFRFLTTATGTTTTNTRMVIDGNGSVSIGKGPTAADTSSLLELSSTTKGFLPPRQTEVQKSAIASPAQALEVYNTTKNQKEIYNGSYWDVGSLNGGLPALRPSLLLDFANSKTLDPRITFTRSTTATRVNEKGLIETVAINQPRFDHDSTTLESLGLLIEESRTNLITRSGDISHSDWLLTNATIIPNSALAPDGTMSASTLIAPASSNQSHTRQAPNLTASTTYTASAFVKRKDFDWFQLSITDKSNSVRRVYFDLVNKVVGTAFTGYVGRVQEFPNGWLRLSITFDSATGALDANSFRLQLASADNTINTIGDGTTIGTYVWGAQLEAGSFPTSYIPTVSSSVLRASDNASMTGTNFSSWYNNVEGTFLARAITNGTVTSTASDRRHIFALLNGSSDEFSPYVSLNVLSSSIRVSSGSLTTTILSSGFTPAQGVPFMFATAINGTSANTSVNGGSVNSSSPTIPISAVNALNIGLSGSLGRYLNGTISKFSFYPKRLTNPELQAVSR
jgi:hypothetical protein